MEKNASVSRPRISLVIKIIALLFISIVIVIVAPWVYYTALYIYDRQTQSSVFIMNYSGSDVRFKQIKIDNKVVWEGNAIATKKPADKPGKQSRPGVASPPSFRAPKAMVELKADVVNQKGESQTLFCQLDNRSRPCFFEAHITDDGLVCSDCDNVTPLD